jgi:hypothetical protein
MALSFIGPDASDRVRCNCNQLAGGSQSFRQHERVMMLPFRSHIRDPITSWPSGQSSSSPRMKIALLFLLIGAIVWWSHVGTSPSAELTDKAVGPA